MQGLVDLSAQLDADIPPKRLEGWSLAKGKQQQRVQKLAAALAIQVGLVCDLSLVARAEGVKKELAEVAAIIVIAGDECVQSASKTIDGRIEGGVVVVGEDDVEVAIEVSGRQVAEMPRNEGEADEVGLGALGRRRNQSAGDDSKREGRRRTCPKTSDCVSVGRSSNVLGEGGDGSAALPCDSAGSIWSWTFGRRLSVVPEYERGAGSETLKIYPVAVFRAW